MMELFIARSGTSLPHPLQYEEHACHPTTPPSHQRAWQDHNTAAEHTHRFRNNSPVKFVAQVSVLSWDVPTGPPLGGTAVSALLPMSSVPLPRKFVFRR